MWIMSNYQLKPRHQVKRFSTHFRKVYTLDFFHEWIHQNDAICEAGDTCSKASFSVSCAVFVWMLFRNIHNFFSSNRPASFHLPRENRGYKTHLPTFPLDATRDSTIPNPASCGSGLPLRNWLYS